MNKLILFCLLLVAAVACSSTKKTTVTSPKTTGLIIPKTTVETASTSTIISQQKDTSPPKEFKIDTLLKVAKGPCFGNCPVYEYVVFNDGTILWKGIKHTNRLGNQISKLNRNQVTELNSLLSPTDISNLASKYPVKQHEYIADIPITHYTFFIGTIKHIQVNHSAPSLLKSISKKMENWLTDSEWLKLDN